MKRRICATPAGNFVRFRLLLLFSLSGISFVFPQAGQDTIHAEDMLNMSLEELMNVEIFTASKVSQKRKEAPATIRIITAEQIRKRGYFTLEQVFADLPGFQFRNINGFNSYSFMRGLPSQNNLTLMLVDGIQINELNSGGYYGGGQYNLSNVEQIEIVYGPSSALYGTNAVSGIVNIITKKPEEANKGHISGSLGNFRTNSLDFGYETIHPSRDIGFRLSGMYKASGKADLREAKGDYNWTDNMENFENDYSLDAYFHVGQFNIGVTTQIKQASRTTAYKTIDDKYLDHGTTWNIWFLNAYAGYTYDKKKTWSNSSRIYLRNSTVLNSTIGYILKADSAFAGDQVGYFRPGWLLGAENQFNYHPNDFLYFIAGVNYEHESVAESFSQTHSGDQDINPPTPGTPVKLDNDLFSIYLQGQVWFLRYFQFMAGVRQDFSSYYHDVFIPRAALVANAGHFTGRISYNEAFRAPRPWDYTAGIGNDDLKPELMKAAELYLSYTLWKVLNLEVSLYRNWLSKMLTTEYVDTLGNWRWINQDQVNVTGIEAGVTLKVNKVSFFGYYTYNDPRDQDGNMVPEISRNVVNAGVTWAICKVLNLNVGGYYYGKRLNPPKPYGGLIYSSWIDDAFILNGNLSWFTRQGLDLQLIVNNILNTEYYHPSNLKPDRYRQPQRAFLVKATWHFDFKRNNRK